MILIVNNNVYEKVKLIIDFGNLVISFKTLLHYNYVTVCHSSLISSSLRVTAFEMTNRRLLLYCRLGKFIEMHLVPLHRFASRLFYRHFLAIMYTSIDGGGGVPRNT